MRQIVPEIARFGLLITWQIVNVAGYLYQRALDVSASNETRAAFR